MRKLRIVILVLTLAILLMACGKEKYRMVKVETYDGDVELLREGEAELFEGINLIPNDGVTTGDESDALLLVDEDKHLYAGANTKFTVNATGTEDKGRVTVDLEYGQALITIDNKLSDNSTFEVSTPNATLSVRGTTFEVVYDNETGETILTVYEGKVWISNGNEEDVIEAGSRAIVTNDSFEKSVSEDIMEEETATVQKQYSSDELQRIILDITYNSDASTEELFFEYTKDGYDYFSSDLIGNDGKNCGIHETVRGKGKYELYFSGEIAERTDAIFRNLYSTSIETYRDVIDDTFMELAQKSADEKIDPTRAKLKNVDITDKMPDKLSLVIDGSTLDLYVAEVELNGNRCAKAETEPENATVPYWVDDNGNYRYLEHIVVCFKVPIEQMTPLYAFYDAAEEQQQKLVDSGAPKVEEYDKTEAEIEQTSESSNQTITDIDLIGTWYDPTGYDAAEFTFNGDGTGTINWGNSTDNLTYSLSGSTVNIVLPNNTNSTITIGNNCLYHGGSKLIKK